MATTERSGRMTVDPVNVELGVSEFVALLNQTLEYAYTDVVITGELANLRVSKNKWLYFDLKDETATVKFFGTVYQLPGPLEDGMLLRVRGVPKLHNLYGFSINVSSIQPAGEGTIKRAAQLLQVKLAAEGLFDDSRKRILPYPPRHIGLVTSRQSAAYADFIKIINARWRGLRIELIDVQVQGEAAPPQIVAALEQFNAEAEPPEVLVLVRGEGSPEDLAAFSSEPVTRAVAASRIPTLVAIGHEIDICLAELAADRRASTPSNAAELLVPDRTQALNSLPGIVAQLGQSARSRLKDAVRDTDEAAQSLGNRLRDRLNGAATDLTRQSQLLTALSPLAVLDRGYAVVRYQGKSLRDVACLKSNVIVEVQLARGGFSADIRDITSKESHGQSQTGN